MLLHRNQAAELALAANGTARYHQAMNTINLDPVFELPLSERIRLVEEIWDSVAKDAAKVDLQPWHLEELDRRVAEFERNPTEGVPWSELKRRVLASE